jgi:hypothetical protein
MRLVILESPFAGDFRRNEDYLTRCIRDSVLRGEAPFASHRMYPGALSEATERDLGIRAGYSWWKVAAAIVFYTDYGWSPGMHKAKQRAKTMQILIEERRLQREDPADEAHRRSLRQWRQPE